MAGSLAFSYQIKSRMGSSNGDRRLARHKTASVYFKPDDDAQYAETHEIDLSQVRSFVAKYPNPDDVVSVSEQEGMRLDGCFIGA